MKHKSNLIKNFISKSDCSNVDILSYKITNENEKNSGTQSPNGTGNNHVNHTDGTEAGGPATFEQAIEATSFGWFNVLVLALTLPGSLATSFDTTSLSFVIPVAQCDLKLTAMEKGSLNAVTYAGMITTPFIWGFIADTLGRRKPLMFGFCVAAFFDICTVFSTNYYMLVALKFLDGCVICGPFALMMSYISELHGQRYRSRIVLFSGIAFGMVNILMPCLAWLVLPRTFFVELIPDVLALRSWNLFLFIAAMPAIFSAIALIFFPESPKFLMSIGKNDEAMEVFQKIYSLNTGKPKDTYPIKALIEEISSSNEPSVSVIDQRKESSVSRKSIKLTLKKKLANGWQQFKPLFCRPYVTKVMVPFIMNYTAFGGINSLRLWLPQLFSLIETYETEHPGESGSICDMLAEDLKRHNISAVSLSTLNTTEDTVACVPNEMQDSVFINYIILGFVQGVLYISAGAFVNILGRKILLLILFGISGVLGYLMYIVHNSLQNLLISMIYCSFMSIAITVTVTIAVELVPTSLRTMTVSLLMMCGRSGAMTGNILLPYFIELGCLAPFLMIGSAPLISLVIALFLPRKDSQELL